MKFILRMGIAVTLLFLIFSFQTRASFSDIQSHKYKKAIEFLQEQGIFKGYPDFTFRPEALMTRAEVVTVLIAQQYKELTPKNCFTDVQATAWYSLYVCKAQELGITKGYSNGSFQPGKTVSFTEALVMLQRAYKISIEIAEGPPWFLESVRSASAMNIIPLDVDGFGMPFTRGQMADMLTRFLKFQEGKLDEYLISFENSIGLTYESIASMQDYREYWKATIRTPSEATEMEFSRMGGKREVAYAFFEEFKNFYGLKDPQNELVVISGGNALEPVEAQEDITFHQRYRGIPVEDARAEVEIDYGTIVHVTATLLPNLDVKITPEITQVQAEKAALESTSGLYPNTTFLIDNETALGHTKLVIFHEGIYRRDKKYPTRLAWKMHVKRIDANPPSFFVFVDAETGSILAVKYFGLL